MNKVLILATDDSGGAGKAALRTLKAINRTGRDCKMFVKNRLSNDIDVIQSQAVSKFPLLRRVKNYYERHKLSDLTTDGKYYFAGKYDDISYLDISLVLNGFVPDTIIITWISWFLSPETIKQYADSCKAKIVIYPMDMSLFTGGCHYAWNCSGFQHNCQNCPAILSVAHKQLAAHRLDEKKRNWKGNDVEFWACSSGVYSEVKSSSIAEDEILKHVFIPIDEQIFNSDNRDIAKRLFNFDASDIVILFGSTFSYEERKGLNLFIDAINIAYNNLTSEEISRVKIVIAGRKKDKTEYNIPFTVVDIDYIKDDSYLSLLYQSSDILVCPSIQDSGPMMINEAQMCGLPVVAFNIGVAPDLLINGVTGFVCETANVQQLALSIIKIINGDVVFDNSRISYEARSKTSFSSFANLIAN
jgi:glycosyltransferase involved in cell wall biosynthesis